MVRRRNPTQAETLAEAFHGRPARHGGQVAFDLPRALVLLGEVEEIVYRAPADSGRFEDGALWVHQFGDTGSPFGVREERPLLAYDPEQPGLLFLLSDDGEAFFVDERGIVG